MKVFVKTLKGTQFEIEVKLQDTVEDVKKNIESVQGPDVYPAAKQMLIHQGKVLNDDTTMEENGVSENSFIVIMLSKNKSSSATPAAAPPPSSTTNAPSDNLADTVHRILDRGGGEWDRDTVVRTLHAASNNEEIAVLYLRLGLGEDPSDELPPVAGAPPPQAAQQPPPPGPNANPLNLFPQDRPAASGAGGSLNFLNNIPQFQPFRLMVQNHPQLLQPVIQHFGRQHPQLAELIREHQDELVRMLLQPLEEGDLVEIEPFRITVADLRAINRLQALGFKKCLVANLYLVCDRNEEMAANYLLDHMDEFEE